jgi:protein-tyrosine phosphatase
MMADPIATDGPGTEDARPGARVPAEGILNLRDVGGYPTTDGRRVRLGLLYRSTALDRATDADLRELARRGIRTIFDLRTAAEREAGPDRVPGGASSIELDVMADAPGASPARIAQLASQPQKANRLLGRADIAATFRQAYRGLVSLPSASASYRALFLRLAEESALPALYHCTTGKDRTGWATAALLLLLGVPEPAVYDDYLLSNEYLLRGLQPVLDRFAEQGGDPALLKPVLGVEAEYLRAALEEVARSHGTIERYFADGLGLDAAARQRLRDAFLE